MSIATIIIHALLTLLAHLKYIIVNYVSHLL